MARELEGKLGLKPFGNPQERAGTLSRSEGRKVKKELCVEYGNVGETPRWPLTQGPATQGLTQLGGPQGGSRPHTCRRMGGRRRKKCLASPLPTLPSGYASLAQTQPESEGEEARLPQTRGTKQGRKRQKWIGRWGGVGGRGHGEKPTQAWYPGSLRGKRFWDEEVTQSVSQLRSQRNNGHISLL